MAFLRCGIVSVPEPGFSPYTFAGVRGPNGGGTFLSISPGAALPLSIYY